MTTNIVVLIIYVLADCFVCLLVYVANVFNVFPNIHFATSGIEETEKQGSFPNKTVDRKEGLNIAVNIACPHSVHSFNNCSRMGVNTPSVNLRVVRSVVKAWLAGRVRLRESDM